MYLSLNIYRGQYSDYLVDFETKTNETFLTEAPPKYGIKISLEGSYKNI